ncbi:MAG TPA: hypothetical protein VFZ47_04510 [Chitinophagaceae bacterium]
MKYLIYLAFMAIAIPVSAQNGGFVLSYPIALPMGSTTDYISKTSFRGINMEFLKAVRPGLELGLETGWNVFYQKEEEKEYKEGTASVSGIQYRYINAVPILAEAKFYKTSGRSLPFAGLGLGVLYVDQSTDFGLYRLSNDAWQFCLRPEIGFMFKAEKGVLPYIGAKYYLGFNGDELDGQSFISINIGLMFSK